MTKQVNSASRPAAESARAKLSAHQLRRVIVWTEILSKPVSRRQPRFPR